MKYAPKNVDLWEENLEVLRIFSSLSTQWRVNMASIQGLDYVSVETAFRLHGIKRKHWKRMFEDIQILEHAALEKLNEKRDG